MGTPIRLVAPAFLACLLAFQSTSAHAQSLKPEAVTTIAAVDTGSIQGTVIDEAGRPVDGAVVSALGGTTAFAVSDKTGQFTLKQLPPGPYLVRVHMAGFLAARSTMINVRPSARSASSFTLRREGSPNAPRIAEASVAGAAVGAAPAGNKTGDRDDSELGWRLRHLKRGVLKETDTFVAVPQDDNWFLGDSIEFIGRAFGTSARAAKSLFSDLSLGGQVNLLTTGAFDDPVQLLQLDRTTNVAFFSVGAPVGSHGEWNVRAAMNQTDLSSWMVAGNYEVKADVPHRYRFGMSYSLQRYEGGNSEALSVADAARNVGSLYAVDEWRVSPMIAVEYGASYAHYGYLDAPSLFSPRGSVTFSPSDAWRVRLSASRDVSAPGAEEFLPPVSAEYLPPQRTFSALSAAGLRTQASANYEIGLARVFNGASLAVRAFDQQIENQTVTVFGLRRADSAPAALGHYFVGSAGDASLRGVGVTFTHALSHNVRGSVDYSVSTANWIDQPAPVEYAVLTHWMPSVVRANGDRIQDLTTSLEAEVPVTATRVVVLYKLNNAFAGSSSQVVTPVLAARFDVRVTQSLPFMNFRASQWEMLVGVRNLFHESLANTSAYDELLVVRPPKRVVGGLTVRF